MNNYKNQPHPPVDNTQWVPVDRNRPSFHDNGKAPLPPNNRHQNNLGQGYGGYQNTWRPANDQNVFPPPDYGNDQFNRQNRYPPGPTPRKQQPDPSPSISPLLKPRPSTPTEAPPSFTQEEISDINEYCKLNGLGGGGV